MHTTDGGATWSEQTAPISFQANLWDVDFIDANRGWAVGGDSGGVCDILSTTDGGANWTAESCPPSAVSQLGVSFLDANEGWSVGHGGKILHTTDGGTTWTLQPNGASDRLFDVVAAIAPDPNGPGTNPFRLDFEYGLPPSEFGWLPLVPDGTFSESVEFTTNPDGERFHLRKLMTDGGGWYLDLTGLVALGRDWTFEMDVKRTLISGQPNGGNDLGIFRVGVGEGSGHALPVPESNDGQWHNLRMEMDHGANQVRHYVDDVLFATPAPIDDLIAGVASSNAIVFLFGNGGQTVEANFDNVFFTVVPILVPATGRFGMGMLALLLALAATLASRRLRRVHP